MRETLQSFAPAARRLRPALAGLVATATLGLAAPAATASPARVAADREFAQAVQFYQQGRLAPAFGAFIALANRGDVDAARIALFMHQYGATLYGAHWEAGREDVEYWNTLVRNSTTAGRPQPDFTPLAISRGKVKQVRAPARPATGVVGNR